MKCRSIFFLPISSRVVSEGFVTSLRNPLHCAQEKKKKKSWLPNRFKSMHIFSSSAAFIRFVEISCRFTPIMHFLSFIFRPVSAFLIYERNDCVFSVMNKLRFLKWLCCILIMKLQIIEGSVNISNCRISPSD